MSTPEQVLNSGDQNVAGDAMAKASVGSVIAAGGMRVQRDVVAVASNACTLAYSAKAVLFVQVTGGSAGNGEKTIVAPGATLAAGQVKKGATPTATTLSFFAGEVTGADAVAEVHYTTTDPPLDASGNASLGMQSDFSTSTSPGTYV